MLRELHIENLAVIDAADLSFEPGLNVISGETGAGKTILAHAISLLLGARADSGFIRPGAAEASVEAIFTVPEGCFADLENEIDIPEGNLLAVRRRISRDGKSRAFLSGRTVTLAILGELTGRLLAFSAQHEQRRLMMASRQLDILDDFAGPELSDLLDEYRILYDQRAEKLRQLQEMSRDTEAQERESELLRFQLQEIEAAGLSAGEDIQLEEERRRLLGSRELREASGGLASVVSGGEGGESSESLLDSLSQAIARLEGTAGVDPALDEITERLKKSFYELEEAGRAARDYAEGVQDDPERLAAIEERLDLIGQLKRKYNGAADSGISDATSGRRAGLSSTGGSMDGSQTGGVEGILHYADDAGERLALLTGAAEGRPALEMEIAAAGTEMLRLAGDISELRREAAARLEEQAGMHMRELAFHDCGFEVRLTTIDAGDGSDGDYEAGADAASNTEAAAANFQALTRTGADMAEFYVRLNPGMPATPLSETASGGEMSRIMLAIKSAVSANRETATLVFDEIDAGIGGETGSAVGAKLKSLAGNAQIICITHLPQIAACADAGFRVVKNSDNSRTSTEVERLEGEAMVDELCRMMGSKPEDTQARAHAMALLDKS
ncbi:MAG: DNA repair protein RecN [Thermoleophilia bacterium]|nr:DNA repair protein RecN [Thermoleophilia bacterium]